MHDERAIVWICWCAAHFARSHGRSRLGGNRHTRWAARLLAVVGLAAGPLASAADPPVHLALAPGSIPENGGAATLTLRTADGGASSRSRRVALWVGGSATPGLDFRLADAAGRTLGKPFALVLPAGRSSVTAAVHALRDRADDDSETVVVGMVGDPGSRRTLTIADHAPAPAGSPPRLERLDVERAHGEMYPAFDPETFHYAVKCGSPGSLRLGAAADSSRTVMRIEGRTMPSRVVELEVGDLDDERDVVIELAGEHGGRVVYTVHCVPNNFPEATAVRRPGAWEGLIALSLELRARGRRGGWIVLLDGNGVPRFHRRMSIHGRVSHFRTHAGGAAPYSVAVQRGSLGRDENWEMVLFDAGLNEVRRVRAPGLAHTDNHDFVVEPDGGRVFLAYEPAVRDLRGYLDGTGVPYGRAAPVRDSVVLGTDADGRQTLLWNSWGRFALADCMDDGKLPEEYAHANSLQRVDGDIVASFRGCSQVLRIDAATGEVKWRLGTSVRRDAEWVAAGGAAPLRIEGDPRGGFCRQHAARIVGNGHLLLFDNGGGACPVDPETGARAAPGGGFSRAVEYALDLGAGTAAFLRDHSLGGTRDQYSRAQGHVEMMDNGHWLVSWGIGPTTSVTEVDPGTGEELLSIRFVDAGMDVPVRAYPVHPAAWPAATGR